MLTIDGAGEDLEGLYGEYKQISQSMYASIAGMGRRETLASEVDLFGRIADGYVVYIEEGFFRLHQGAKVVRLYSEGDIVGFQCALRDWTLTSEYSTRIVLIERRALVAALKANGGLLDNWLALEDLENRINVFLCAALVRERPAPSLTLRRFDDGETIIAEGAEATEVYEMISGAATVLLRDVAIGAIERGEIFGEMSFLAECPRTATVKADGPCFVRVVQREAFHSILEADFHLSASIATTLAKRIIALNHRLSPPPKG